MIEERLTRQDMQELRDRLLALKDRVSHVMARL
jgi:hypothetical protein